MLIAKLAQVFLEHASDKHSCGVFIPFGEKVFRHLKEIGKYVSVY